MNKNVILEKWNTYYGSKKGFAKDRQKLLRKPEIDYVRVGKLDLWLLIVDALLLWKFIINNRSKGSVEDLREMLSTILADVFADNDYVRVVAIIEYLPNKVWRKLLWKLNLDFVGFEPFLRRLKEKQISAISDNFYDFLVGRVPRVFSWYEKIFKKVSYQTLLADEELGNRYSTKSAWSYNLLGLDFGFNAYPNGEYDDTEVVEVSPFVFLSNKKHADDFTVNQESGKYWGLYKFVRSNYVYFPNKVVELKTHVCPGFWYTLIMNFIFWVVSPICAVIAFPQVSLQTNMISWEFLTALVGTFTTAWVVAALAKLAIVNFVKLIKKLPEDVWKNLGYLSASAFFPMLIVVVVGIMFLISWFLGGKNIIETILIFSASMFFLKNKFDYRFEKTNTQKSELKIRICTMPWYLVDSTAKILLRSIWIMVLAIKIVNNFDWVWNMGAIFINVIVIAAIAVWNFLIGDFIDFIARFFSDLFEAIVLFLSQMTIYFLVFAAILVVPMLFMMIMDKYTDEKKYPKASKRIVKLNNFLPAILIVLSFVVGYMFYTDYKNSALFFISSLSLIVPMVIFYSLAIWAVVYFTKNSYKHDRRLDQAITVFQKTCGSRSRFVDLAYRSLKSKWFCGLSIDDKEKVADLITEISGYLSGLFNGDKWSDAFLGDTYDLMFKYIDSFDILKKINKEKSCYHVDSRDGLGGFFFRDFIKLVKENKMSVGDIVREIKSKKYQIKRARQEKRQQFFEKVNQKVLQPAAFPFKKTWEYSKTLYKLYELFNKLCPYVAKPKNLLKK